MIGNSNRLIKGIMFIVGTLCGWATSIRFVGWESVYGNMRQYIASMVLIASLLTGCYYILTSLKNKTND